MRPEGAHLKGARWLRSAVNDMLGTAEWTFPVGLAVIDRSALPETNVSFDLYRALYLS